MASQENPECDMVWCGRKSTRSEGKRTQKDREKVGKARKTGEMSNN